MIVKVEPSPRKYKKYRVTMDDGKTFDFGLNTSQTFLDHQNVMMRENYRKRHLANATEKQLIENLVPSPATFSYWLLWGKYTDLKKNVDYLNGLFKAKHKKK